jgi:hypothetical protein
LAAFFPIIDMRASVWVPVATGFFISTNRLFATAKHVVVDENGQPRRELAAIHINRPAGRVSVRSVTYIAAHATADVAIGLLADHQFRDAGVRYTNKCFALAASGPAAGAKVVTMAFPKSELKAADGRFDLKFTSDVAAGILEEYYPAGRDRTMLPGRCYRTSLSIPSGASGGPVAAGNGEVFAINSTGWDGIPVGFVSSVEDLLDLQIPMVELPDGTRTPVTIRELVSLSLVVMR